MSTPAAFPSPSRPPQLDALAQIHFRFCASYRNGPGITGASRQGGGGVFRPASPGNRGSRHSTLPPVVYRAVGSHLMEWLGRAELVWREFGIIPAVAIAAAIILSLEVVRLQRKINGLIARIGETP